jgi:hypothetical protein
MRTSAKVAVALSLAIGTLATTAIVAAAGSNTEGQRATDVHTTPPSGGYSGPIALNPIVPGPCGYQVRSGPEPDGTISYTPCPGDPSAPTPVPMPLEPTPGMAGVHAIVWDSASVGDDGATVTVNFSMGVAPCSVLDHVDVAYATDTVTITLFEGHDPNAGNVGCIDIAMLASTTVTLDQPLAGRKIVDGAGA